MLHIVPHTVPRVGVRGYLHLVDAPQEHQQQDGCKPEARGVEGWGGRGVEWRGGTFISLASELMLPSSTILPEPCDRAETERSLMKTYWSEST